MAKKLSALRYYGGKSASRKTGSWIASLLPYARNYAEPFAGMLGVLLQRRTSHNEMVNDVDGNLIAWWRAVRDHPKKLGRLVRNTPYSKDEYERAAADLAKGEYDDPLRRALDYQICIEQSFGGGTGGTGWMGIIMPEDGPAHRKNLYKQKQIADLARRMEDVGIHNMDATAFLAKLSKYREITVYCDPPYVKSSDTAIYGHAELDVDAMTAALKKCLGFVAVSGYKDDWDHLGWHRYERKSKAYIANPKNNERTEVLWTNKPAVGVPKRTLME